MLEELFYSVFEKEHFVRVVDRPPLLKHVRGSNYCDVHVTYDERTNKIITVSTIDNLMKGAARTGCSEYEYCIRTYRIHRTSTYTIKSLNHGTGYTAQVSLINL